MPVFGSKPDFDATAVMVGKWVVVGNCRLTVSAQGAVRISLNNG